LGRQADWQGVARLRRLCIAVIVLAALAGFASHRALAVPPACPAGGPNHLESAHFTVDYDGTKANPDYVTETQAGDILAAAERAYKTYADLGYPPPLVNASGKTGFSIIDLSSTGFSSIYCPGDQDFDSGDVGTEDTAYSVGFDVFGQIALGLTPNVGNVYFDTWLIQGVNSWASYKALGYPASSAGDLGPYEMSLDCQDQAGTQACSKDGYENEGQSRWPFYEYLAERFGQTFFLEVFADANAAADEMTGLQNALIAHGTTLSAEYAAYATKLIAGGWAAPSLNLAIPPISGAAIHAGAATGDTAPQTFGIDHLATRYIEIDRGDGDASHACYTATLTIHVTIPAGVTSQPTFFWNGSGSTPVPLTVVGSSATATVPWDTCAWQNKGLLSLPNTSLAANGMNFVVWTHVDVTSTLATATPPPAPASPFGPIIDAGSAQAVPDIVVVGPELIRVAANATKLHVVVMSSGEGSMTVMFGSLSLGTALLRPGTNNLYFTLPLAPLAQSRRQLSTNILTLTPTSADGKTTGSAVTQRVAFSPATKVVKHKKAAVKHKKKKLTQSK
jgi:hypothetical protein